jgi:DHA1 family bicyclomycin/chloramphenicol resistance-like MFS transporter
MQERRRSSLFTAATRPPSRVTLIVLTAVAVLSLNLFLPSLPAMAQSFDVRYAAVSLSIAGYLFLSAFLTLTLGPVADIFGRRPVLLISFSLFTLASIGAALAPTYEVFMAFRMVQAACATGSTLTRAIVLDVYTPSKGVSVMGYIAMAMAVAPMLGPIIGGLIEETLGWRYVFWLFALLGAMSVWLIWSDLGETFKSQSLDLSEHVAGYFEVLKSPAFWAFTLTLGFSVSGFFVFLAGAPLVAAEVFGLAPSRVGLVLGSTAVGYFAGSFIAGRIAESASLAQLLVGGRMIGVVGTACALIYIVIGGAQPWIIFGFMIAIGLANGISMPAANSGTMRVRPDLAGSAAGLSSAIATVMGAVSSAVTGYLVTPLNGDWMLAVLLVAVSIMALGAAFAAGRFSAQLSS